MTRGRDRNYGNTLKWQQYFSPRHHCQVRKLISMGYILDFSREAESCNTWKKISHLKLWSWIQFCKEAWVAQIKGPLARSAKGPPFWGLWSMKQILKATGPRRTAWGAAGLLLPGVFCFCRCVLHLCPQAFAPACCSSAGLPSGHKPSPFPSPHPSGQHSAQMSLW